jgi:hypothetical protein
MMRTCEPPHQSAPENDTGASTTERPVSSNQRIDCGENPAISVKSASARHLRSRHHSANRRENKIMRQFSG